MPVILSSFRPPPFLGNGHVQTILAALLPRRIHLDFKRERWELDDGDFLDLDWSRNGQKRLVILTHGLEGGSTDTYIRGMAAAMVQKGWDALVWNFRGCSGEINRLPRFYHSGETGDLRALIARAATDYSQIALISFSLGGNVTLKYLGESAPHPTVVGAVGVSVPVDIAASARALDRGIVNRIYMRRFMRPLVAKIREKARVFPNMFDLTGIERMRTFAEFDGRYTGPLHGFRDAPDYWARASARPFLTRIMVPTLLLNARNDPFLAPECFPVAEAEANPALSLEAPASGGHVGFIDFAQGLTPWWERRAVEFLASIGNR